MADLVPVFEALSALMRDNATGMEIESEGPTAISFHAGWPNPQHPDKPMWFGQVKLGKSAVSYHLMPVYSHGEVAGTISPELRKRMQGKSCFNFRKVDPGLFAELGALTRLSADTYATPFALKR